MKNNETIAFFPFPPNFLVLFSFNNWHKQPRILPKNNKNLEKKIKIKKLNKNYKI